MTIDVVMIKGNCLAVPIKLAKVMIETHTEPGEWILDPYAGSGSTVLIEMYEDPFSRTLEHL